MTWFWERATWQRKLSATSGMENSSPCVSATPESMSRCGTGGALKLAEPLISDPVLVLNGDSYVEWTLFQCWNCSKPKMPMWSSCCKQSPTSLASGSVALDQDGRVTQFVEKGVCGGSRSNQCRRLFASKTDRARSASRHSDLAGEGGISPPSRPPGVWVGLHRAFHRHRNTG